MQVSPFDLDRRAAIYVDSRQIIQMLELPEDVRVLSVNPMNDPVGIQIIVTKPDLPVVDPSAQAPIVQKYVTVEGDTRTVEYLWPKDGE